MSHNEATALEIYEAQYGHCQPDELGGEDICWHDPISMGVFVELVSELLDRGAMKHEIAQMIEDGEKTP